VSRILRDDNTDFSPFFSAASSLAPDALSRACMALMLSVCKHTAAGHTVRRPLRRAPGYDSSEASPRNEGTLVLERATTITRPVGGGQGERGSAVTGYVERFAHCDGEGDRPGMTHQLLHLCLRVLRQARQLLHGLCELSCRRTRRVRFATPSGGR
jgi:hypothetical protein